MVREDTIYVMFSNYRKARKIFLFNDIFILARRDWRDKHHVIEKIPLKDVRVSDILERDTSLGATNFIEVEILPASEDDSTNRYILSFLNLIDKQTWLEGYKALVKSTVRFKNLEDISMTSTSSDQVDDEEAEKVGTTLRSEAGGKSDWKARLNMLETQVDDFTKQIAQLKEALEVKSKSLDEGNLFIQKLNEDLELRTQSTKTLENEKVLLQVQLDAIKESQSSIEENVKNLESTNKDLKGLVKEREMELKTLDTEKIQLNQKLYELQSKFQIREAEFDSMAKELSTAKSIANRYKTESDQLKENVAIISHSKDILQKNLDQS